MSRSNPMIRLIGAMAAVWILSFASEVQGGFTLTETGLTINGLAASNPSLATVTFGGTMIGIAPLSPQSFAAASGADLLDVSAQSTTPVGPGFGDTGSFTFSESFTVVGTGNLAGLAETATLSGTFNLTQGFMGAIISNMGTPTTPSSSLTVTINTGSGFSFSGYSYTQPSPASSVGNPSAADGNVSLTINPSVVPEPSSLTMLGLGMIAVGAAARRRERSR